MKLKAYYSKLLIVLAIIATQGCKEKVANKTETVEKAKLIGVFDFDNKEELSAYTKLNLDKTHPNLLNPQISKSDYNSVVKSWTDLHQRIGGFLSENNFDWGVKDSTITIVQKIYFKPNGEIKNYFFNILNKNLTKEKREQFSNLITNFAKQHSIKFQSDESFAQCGKTKYVNK